MFFPSLELIDTLWNVNMLNFPQIIKISTRINRYIMECKLISISLLVNLVFELIDTLWNVNLFK